MYSSWDAVVLTSCVLSSNLEYLPCFVFPTERDYLPFCGLCAAYLSYYSFSTLHSFEECTGTFNKHIFTSWVIARMSHIFFLALSSTSLLSIGWRYIFSSLSFPFMNVTVFIFPCGGFRMCPSFVGFIGDFHLIENLVGLLVSLPFSVPSL